MTADARELPPDRPAPGAVDLTGTVALVTGGGRGIGRFLAERLAGAGAAVALVARSQAQLAEAVAAVEAAGGVAAAATADVGDEEAVAAAVAALTLRLGPVDLLVNNAGVSGPAGNAWEVDPADWWRTVEVNLRGTYLCTRAVLPGMVARGAGRIVNITSRAGVFRWPLVSAYSVSKAAVVKLTENLATETRRHGVRVFSVDPGIVPIGLSEPALQEVAPPGTAEALMHAWVRRELAEGRGAPPERGAELVLRLAAGHGDALSGHHISVHDDLDAVLANLEQVRRDGLYMLGTRRLTS